MRYKILLFALLGTIHISAQSNQKVNWQSLFGMRLMDAIFDSTIWHEENGILTAESDEPIWTIDEHENFELDLEFKNDHGTNSGVIIYCTNTDNWIPNSVEIQIADDYYAPWENAQSHERCGAIYGHLGPRHIKVVKKPGEWNHMRIRCVGQRISVILNGRKVTEMNMSKWTSGTTNPDGSEIPEWLPTPYAKLPTKGYIGLQGKHGDATVWFRNLKIREVKTTGNKELEVDYSDMGT